MPQITIVGAGIVGLACAWRAQRDGWRVTVIDRDFEGDRASHGNAGGIAVSESTPLVLAGANLQVLKWLVDPLGPLSIRLRHAPRLLPWFMAFNRIAKPDNFNRISHALAALNNRVYDDLLPMLADLDMLGELHHRGALSVYESERSFQADAHDWAAKRALGVAWRAVDAGEIQALEPQLAPVFHKGVMIEDWTHVDDPKRIVDRLRAAIVARGAKLVTADVTRLDIGLAQRPAAIGADGARHAGDRLLIACGAWSARLSKSAGDPALLESERGYNTTLPAAVGRLSREVIFADKKFVATPLSIGLRIGGAAEFAGLDAPANYRRSSALLTLAQRYLPQLDTEGAKQWMGQRPTTPDSLPVIGPSPHNANLLYAFGHGHLGLTQAATTATLIGELLSGKPSAVALAPYSIARFSKAVR